jgi:hypothetical protein
MGLDLTLCPIKFADIKEWDWWLAHERLGLHRDYYFFERITERGRWDEGELERATDPKPIPDYARVDWYGDEGIEHDVKTDPYGSPLTFVYAEEFKGIDPDEIKNEWNRAVLIFLQALPPKIPVLLWWH